MVGQCKPLDGRRRECNGEVKRATFTAVKAASAMCCGLCACTLAEAQVPTAFSVTNECSVAIDFRLTDDEVMDVLD